MKGQGVNSDGDRAGADSPNDRRIASYPGNNRSMADTRHSSQPLPRLVVFVRCAWDELFVPWCTSLIPTQTRHPPTMFAHSRHFFAIKSRPARSLVDLLRSSDSAPPKLAIDLARQPAASYSQETSLSRLRTSETSNARTGQYAVQTGSGRAAPGRRRPGCPVPIDALPPKGQLANFIGAPRRPVVCPCR
jgi:hypothetical protein